MLATVGKDVVLDEPAYQDESWALPAAIVKEIMQDETCVALPPLRPLATGVAPRFLVSLRDLQSQQEYTHPKPITSLQNYNLYFINCYLLADVNLLAEHNPFPSLTQPGVNGAGPVTFALMRLQGGLRLFRVIVVQAPPEDANIAIMARSPPLPTGILQFYSNCETSPERKSCLRHFAISGIARSFGLKVEQKNVAPASASTAADAELADLMVGAQLVHGAGAQQEIGARYDVITGACHMHELERSAASVSLPLVLRYLYFLQFNLDDDPCAYQILAPTKTSYMVRIHSLGGWEVFFLVNMNAMWEACQGAFQPFRSRVPAPCTALGQYQNAEAFVSSLFQRMHVTSVADRTELLRDTFVQLIQAQLRAVQTELNGLSGGPPPADEVRWTPEAFYLKMQQRGMQSVQRELLDKKSVYGDYVEMERARPLLGYLAMHAKGLGLRGRPTPQIDVPNLQQLSVDRILSMALVAFTHCVRDAWNKNPPPSGPPNTVDHANHFLNFLQETEEAYVSIDYELLPIILQSCTACPCSAWWERTVAHLVPRGDAKHILRSGACRSVLICNTFLHHSQHFTSFFPKGLFPKLSGLDKWASLLDEVCESRPTQKLGEAMANYERVQLVDPQFAATYGSREGIQRRHHYCTALALGMLYGRSNSTFLANIKAH